MESASQVEIYKEAPVDTPPPALLDRTIAAVPPGAPRAQHLLVHRNIPEEILTMFEPPDEHYRTCAECGADCQPEPFETDSGIKIAFSCPEHGVHTVVDPFEGSR